MMPARIVAVTRLMSDVLLQLETDSHLDAGSAGQALLQLLGDHKAELAAIHAAAVREMQDLPAQVIAQQFRPKEAVL